LAQLTPQAEEVVPTIKPQQSAEERAEKEDTNTQVEVREVLQVAKMAFFHGMIPQIFLPIKFPDVVAAVALFPVMEAREALVAVVTVVDILELVKVPDHREHLILAAEAAEALVKTVKPAATVAPASFSSAGDIKN